MWAIYGIIIPTGNSSIHYSAALFGKKSSSCSPTTSLSFSSPQLFQTPRNSRNGSEGPRRKRFTLFQHISGRSLSNTFSTLKKSCTNSSTRKRNTLSWLGNRLMTLSIKRMSRSQKGGRLSKLLSVGNPHPNRRQSRLGVREAQTFPV